MQLVATVFIVIAHTFSSHGLSFECGDLLQTASLCAGGGCTVGVYVASLLFDDSMMDKLATLLEASPDVRWVATLQRLPMHASARSLRLDTVLSLPMTWDDTGHTEVFVYLRGVVGTLSEDDEAGAGMSAEEADARSLLSRL